MRLPALNRYNQLEKIMTQSEAVRALVKDKWKIVRERKNGTIIMFNDDYDEVILLISTNGIITLV